jgi:hypothetical protein
LAKAFCLSKGNWLSWYPWLSMAIWLSIVSILLRDTVSFLSVQNWLLLMFPL